MKAAEAREGLTMIMDPMLDDFFFFFFFLHYITHHRLESN